MSVVPDYRPATMPERFGVAGLAAAGAAVVYPTVHRLTGLSWPCPLRTVTGIPCPTCGMTTAATSLAGGRLHDALAANPFILLLVAATIVMAVVIALRAVRALPPAQPLGAGARSAARVGLTALFAASWLFQLHRFSFI